MEKQYELLASAKSNINSYNRYPFPTYTDAVMLLKNKSLQPGEIAIGYYFDDTCMDGINAAIAIGNLKRVSNIIIKNPDYCFDEIDRTNKSVIGLNEKIDLLYGTVNHANKRWSEIDSKVVNIEKNMHDNKSLQLLDLDVYTDDL